MHIVETLWVLASVCVGALIAYACGRIFARRERRESASELVERAKRAGSVPVIAGAINVTRPQAHTVEGLEIQYGPQGLVRSVRVGAMNVEHKELLLTMDSIVWATLPNAHKQEVLAAARSTWAAKMCPDGPDIAYVIIKTESGDVVGRADPRSVTLV